MCTDDEEAEVEQRHGGEGKNRRFQINNKMLFDGNILAYEDSALEGRLFRPRLALHI
jgi:hypothetical protein